jgi:hypothetical protein
MLYKVNSRFSEFASKLILVNDDSDYGWKQSHLAAIPTTVSPPYSPKNWAGKTLSTNGRCGPSYNNTACPGKQCCSKYSWCGGSSAHNSAWCSYTDHKHKYHGVSDGIYDGVKPHRQHHHFKWHHHNHHHHLTLSGKIFANNRQCVKNYSVKTTTGYTAAQQGDGHFVIYNKDNKPIWATGKYGSQYANGTLCMQGDGNLVNYKTNGTPYWATGTNGKGTAPYTAILQDDGNFVVYDSKQTKLWSTNTAGK